MDLLRELSGLALLYAVVLSLDKFKRVIFKLLGLLPLNSESMSALIELVK